MMIKVLNKMLLILISSLVLIACSKDNNTTSFSLKGRLVNVDSPYFFITFEDENQIKIDTIFIDKQGAFSYKGKTENLVMASLFFDKKSWSTSIFANKGWNVEIKGDVNRPDLIEIKGGDVNDDLTSFKKKNKDLFSAKADILQTIVESDKDNISQNRGAELKNIDFELINRVKGYVENNPEKIASVVLIQDFFKNEMSIETLDDCLSLLVGDALRFPLTSELKRYSEMLKKSQVGAPAPLIDIKRGDEKLDIPAFKGKFLYLTFTSRDSVIYNMEVPAMMKAYTDLKNKNIEFVSIIIDAPEDSTPPDSIKWQLYYEPHGWASNALRNYNITEIPYGVLISPEGNIIARNIHPSTLLSKIEEISNTKN